MHTGHTSAGVRCLSQDPSTNNNIVQIKLLTVFHHTDAVLQVSGNLCPVNMARNLFHHPRLGHSEE